MYFTCKLLYGLCVCTGDNPRALARGLSAVQRHSRGLSPVALARGLFPVQTHKPYKTIITFLMHMYAFSLCAF